MGEDLRCRGGRWWVWPRSRCSTPFRRNRAVWGCPWGSLLLRGGRGTLVLVEVAQEGAYLVELLHVEDDGLWGGHSLAVDEELDGGVEGRLFPVAFDVLEGGLLDL